VRAPWNRPYPHRSRDQHEELALTGLSLLAALAGLLVVILRLIARGQLHHHIQFLVPAGLLAIAGWLVVGLLFLLCMRQLARLTRRVIGLWCQVPIAEPYLPRPWADGGKAGLRRRLGWLLTDQATWRDLLWTTVNGCMGWLLPVLPAGLLVVGFVGVFAPYTGLQLRILTLAGAALGLWAAPYLLRGYGVFARSMLAPTPRAELSLRVVQLPQARPAALRRRQPARTRRARLPGGLSRRITLARTGSSRVRARPHREGVFQ
jgi:Putative sensor